MKCQFPMQMREIENDRKQKMLELIRAKMESHLAIKQKKNK